MKRRSFLTMLGLAPVVATTAANAKPAEFNAKAHVEDVNKEFAKLYIAGEKPNEFTVPCSIIRSKDNRFVMDLTERRIVIT